MEKKELLQWVSTTDTPARICSLMNYSLGNLGETPEFVALALFKYFNYYQPGAPYHCDVEILEDS